MLEWLQELHLRLHVTSLPAFFVGRWRVTEHLVNKLIPKMDGHITFSYVIVGQYVFESINFCV